MSRPSLLRLHVSHETLPPPRPAPWGLCETLSPITLQILSWEGEALSLWGGYFNHEHPMNSKEPVEVRPLPCPFCDAKAWICEDDDDDTLVFQIGCTTFGCRGLWKDSQVFMTRDEALAPWNRRASLSSEPAIVVRRLGELADRLDDAPDDAWDTVEYVAADLRNLRDKIASGSASTASGRPVTDEDVDRAMRLFGLDVSHDHPDREAMRNVLRYDRANQRSAPSEAAAQSGAPVPTTKEQQ